MSEILKRKARVIAFYLPQFHPIPENDAWWGKGFTEWTVVAQAKPLFLGHRQPNLPGELGFYDLRIPDVREAQAELAREHGIEGFCYWHYWLGNGRRLLERPFEEVLASGEPNFPFCLGWANHSWKGNFFGAGRRTLVVQEYPGEDDHRQHFNLLLRSFRDPRYICVDNKPLFYIYRPLEIPELQGVLHLWRDLASSAGLPGLHVVGEGVASEQAAGLGLDAVSYSNHRLIGSMPPHYSYALFVRKYLCKLCRFPEIYNYRDAARLFLNVGISPENEYPSIVPNWDSTPRFSQCAVVLHGSTPELFRLHVRDAIQKVSHKSPDHRLLFVKSWNEWAEGNYLEPDQKFGRAYLEVLRNEVMLGNTAGNGD